MRAETKLSVQKSQEHVRVEDAENQFEKGCASLMMHIVLTALLVQWHQNEAIDVEQKKTKCKVWRNCQNYPK